MKVEQFLGKEVKYDRLGQTIYNPHSPSGYQMICDVRGWGAIQNLFASTKGAIDMDAAGKFQDEMGEWIADAINKKINKQS